MKNVIGVESCIVKQVQRRFYFFKLYAVMAGSGVLLMQQGYHEPIYDTEK